MVVLRNAQAAENIMTVSNSQIRGAGNDSLAISNTHCIPSDKVTTSSMLNERDVDISSVIALIIGITTGPHSEITVTNLSPSDIDNVYIKTDADKTMTADGFNSVDVTTRGE